MKLSPVSFNLNNQTRNNKIQNQPRLKPMAFDSVSFSANIPKSVFQEASNNALLGFLDSENSYRRACLREFFIQDDEIIAKALQEADDKARKTFCTNEAVLNEAFGKNKIHLILQTAKNDSELMELLNCNILDWRIRGEEFRGPLKMMLSVSDFVAVLERLKTSNKKQLLLGEYTYENNDGCFYATFHETYAEKMNRIAKSEDYSKCYKKFFKLPTEQEQKRLGNIILEVIQDEETTNEEALKLISLYGNRFFTFYDTLYFEELEKYLKSQIN